MAEGLPIEGSIRLLETVIILHVFIYLWKRIWYKSTQQEGWLSPTEHVSFYNQPKAHFGLPWVRPSDNRGKCYMDEKRIQCWSKHSSIYPSIFNRLRAIARYWSEIAIFSYPLHLTPPIGSIPIGIPGKCFIFRKLESWGYRAVKTVWR